VKHGAIFDPIRGDGWIRLCFARSKDIGEACHRLPLPPETRNQVTRRTQRKRKGREAKKSGVPAKAGTHSSAPESVEKWAPTFAGAAV